jgi:hypothetical protein
VRLVEHKWPPPSGILTNRLHQATMQLWHL